MNIAFLFNSDHKSLGGWYGHSVMDIVLKTGVLQASHRNMRLSVGDICTFNLAEPEIILDKVYAPTRVDLLQREQLADTVREATVYTWLFHNMTLEAAKKMHECLCTSKAYVGAMDVSFSNPIHLALFRNSLIDLLRFDSLNASIFYKMGEYKEENYYEKGILETFGFVVTFEDLGARKTIFDNYDGLEHFARVENFQRIFSKLEGLTEDDVSSLSLAFEDIHPKLFEGFAAAARSIETAETEDDIAQAAIAGRRLLEKVANYLRPPSTQMTGGRKLGAAEYKNRIWAYIDETISITATQDPQLLNRLGSEADRLIEFFNKGLHSAVSRAEMERGFRDLALWLSRVIGINPRLAARPYLAYEAQFREILVKSSSK